MGFMDTVKNAFGSGHQYMDVAKDVQKFFDESGGVVGLKSKFESQGLSGIYESWVGSGRKLPMTPEQVQKVMGIQFVQNIATKLNLDPNEAAKKISEMLPSLVSKMSPETESEVKH